MKVLKKIVGLLCLLLSFTELYGQSRVITGRVADDKGIVIPGVTITEVNNLKNGAVTDENGGFKITVTNPNTTLKFSATGFVSSTIALNGKTLLKVALKYDVKGLNEVVVVAYGQQTKLTASGAVSSIKASEIETQPISSIQNTLAGRLPGFFSTQRSGKPGSDAADFFIRGVSSLNGDNQPLIIVDDIQWTYSQVAQLDPSEIETISILKDASTTAVYGVRGANGVLLITTKRGRISKPNITASASFGLDKVIQYPSFLDAYTIAVMQNEAVMNDSYGLSSPLTLPWSPADLQKFKDGSDPYGHPNVNWQKELLKNQAAQNNYSLDIRGGNRSVKYFTSFGYFTQNGLLKDFPPAAGTESADGNYFYSRVNFRSNLDITPTKTLNIRFDLNGRFQTVNNPNGALDAAGLFKELIAFRATSPFSTPLINPNGTYGYANQSWGNGYVNPVDRLANGGYLRNFYNDFNIVVGADQKLDFITPGLYVKANLSYASTINEHRNVSRDVTRLPAYYYNSTTDSYISKGNNQFPVFGLNTGNDANNSVTTFQGSVNYKRSFGVNNIEVLALLQQQSTVIGSAVPLNFRSIVGRLNYDFKHRYGIQLTLTRNGNDLFRPNQRYAVFPSVAGFWNLSEENFFKRIFPFIDLFKFRGSYGLSGSDNKYPTVLNAITYTLPGGVNFFGNGAQEGALVNTAVTWEKKRSTNAGMDLNLFKGRLSFTGDYFYEYRYDQLIAQAGVPLLIGQSVPSANVGISDNKGYELSLSFKDRIGQVSYSVGGNFSHAINKIIYTSEAPDYPNLAQTGRQIGLTKGYHFIGFYQQSDFDPNGQVKAGIPKPMWSKIQPGDLRYADLNGDGLITEADQTYLAKPSIPANTYGFNFGINYKGFSFTGLFQGAFGYSISVFAEGNDIFNGIPQPLQLQSWTPTNAANAIYPRIGFNTSVNNMTWKTVSDYTFVSGNYLRLKSLELGYQLPAAWIQKTGFINSCRLYMSGYNLATWRNTGRFQVDPEIANQSANSNAGSSYPITANYALGIQLGLK